MSRFLPPLLALLVLASCASDPPREGRLASDEGKRPDSPGEAARFRYEQRLSADGTMPDNALWLAKLQRDRWLEMQRAEDRAGVVPASWRWHGPGNVGGRIRGLLIHPTSPNLMWIGSVSGGIWRSNDSGQTWQPVSDFLASLAVSCLAIDPIDRNVLYAGTGEGFFNNHAVRGAGIFRSSDGGNTWVQLPNTAPGPGATQWQYVNRIAIHPANSLVLLAATNEGIYQTLDGSMTAWTRRTAQRALDVKFHPTDGTRAVAGRDDGNALYTTDGGANWAAAAGLPANGERIELAYAAAAPNVVFASVTRRVGNVHSTAGLFRSLDGGQNYAARNTTVNYLGSQGWYDNAIWVDPVGTTPGALQVVVGGIDLWRSADSGTTLTAISDWRRIPQPGDSAHADQHVIVSHPAYNGTTNRTVFFGNDGGLYRANDVTTVTTSSGWTSLNNGLGITQFYGAAVNRTTGVLVGGTQDNATLRWGGTGTNWTATGVMLPPPAPPLVYTGDGGFCAFDAGSPGTAFGEYPWLVVHRSTDGGVQAAPINAGILDSGNPMTANFIAPFVLDPNNADRLLAGGRDLWRSNDARAGVPTWNSIKGAATAFISAIAVAEGNSDVIWVGHNDGEVYRTVNGTDMNPVWDRMDNNATALPDRWVSRIAIDRNDSNRVWVTFQGYVADNVHRTTDGGATWTRRTGVAPGAIPSIPVTSIALHRTEPGFVYVGTDLGLYASEDDGATWSTSNDGPSNVPVDELIWQGNRTLYAVTHGRGVYSADAGPRAQWTGRTSLVSVTATGVQGDQASVFPSISADGRFVAFQSGAGNLGPPVGPPSFFYFVYVHDRHTRETRTVSLDPNGQKFIGEKCRISADGRFVAFDSSAALVADDTNGKNDIFVRDLQLQRTTRVSVASDGTQGNDHSFGFPDISADGRFVAFWSHASNLVAGDGNGVADVFVHDRLSRATRRVSVTSGGGEGNGISGLLGVAISGDGQTVAFASYATNLVPNDTNGVADVFVHAGGLTTRVSQSVTGVEGDGESSSPALSRNGNFVTFHSAAANLVPMDLNGPAKDVFVRDRGANAMEIASVRNDGGQGFGDSFVPSISADGTKVAFTSNAALAPGSFSFNQVYVRDLAARRTELVSVNAQGVGGFDFSSFASLSGNGNSVAFYSPARDLVRLDTNGFADVFVHDRHPSITTGDTARIGTTVTLTFQSPEEAGAGYVAASSLGSSPGILVDTRIIPLNPDLLFVLSLSVPAIFQNFVGVLDGTGTATVRIALPNEPSLVGFVFYTAFLTLRPAAPSGIGSISLPIPLTIVA